MKTTTPILLCVSLVMLPIHAAEPEPQFRPAVGYVAGGAVLCLGGYCVYKLYKTCQRLFPKTKETNGPSASLSFQASGDEYGISWNHTSIGSCVDTEGDQFNAASDDERYVAVLKVTVDDAGIVTSSISAAKAEPEQTQSWEEFRAEVASYGLVISERGDGSKSYSLNRVPCGPDRVPITFNDQTKTVVHAGFDGRMKTIAIERSKDFQSWSPLMSVVTGHGTGFRVDDLTRSGQMFYRVQVSQP